MEEIIFVGNPNAGKSTLFNAFTKSHAHTGNWHGVTVGESSKTVKRGEKEFVFTDLPGVYALDGYSMEEKRAVSYINAHRDALFINVIDVRYLSRSLNLTRELILRGVKVIVVLTMFKRFQQNGGALNVTKLSQRIQTSIYTVDAFDKKEIDTFWLTINQTSGNNAKIAPQMALKTTEMLLSSIYTPQVRKETWVEKLCYNRVLCLPLFFALTAFIFFLTFGDKMLGVLCKDGIEWLICEKLYALVGGIIVNPIVRALVCDGILRSAGGVLSFLPQIAILYAFLLFLEESGYMSALAFTADGVFKKIGLNGRAVFCILLGFGCTAQAILSTRGFEKKQEQSRAIMALPYISCSAKLPVYLTLLSDFFERPLFPIMGLYGLGLLVSLLVFYLQSREDEGDFILELPEMQIPNGICFAKTLLFRLKQFIIKIVTVVTAFTLVVWFISSFDFSMQYVSIDKSILAGLCQGLKYVFYPIGIEDWQTTFALFSGLIAKENVAGLLNLFYPSGLTISKNTAIALAVFILFCAPCISAITASAREIGWKSSILNAVLQTATAIIISYLTYYILQIQLLVVGVIPILLLLFLLKRFCFERVYRSNRRQLKKLHG